MSDLPPFDDRRHGDSAVAAQVAALAATQTAMQTAIREGNNGILSAMRDMKELLVEKIDGGDKDTAQLIRGVKETTDRHETVLGEYDKRIDKAEEIVTTATANSTLLNDLVKPGGRMERLERFRWQAAGIVGLLMFLSPFLVLLITRLTR